MEHLFSEDLQTTGDMNTKLFGIALLIEREGHQTNPGGAEGNLVSVGEPVGEENGTIAGGTARHIRKLLYGSLEVKHS